MSEFVNYCKMCQKPIKEHDDEDLNRCLKIQELSFWKKE